MTATTCVPPSTWARRSWVASSPCCWERRSAANSCEVSMTEQFRGERTLMRVFIGESDKYHGKPLYEALLERFRSKGLAGATVLRGVAGFGASSKMHTDKVLRLSGDLPLIIEVVETDDTIHSILPDLSEMIGGGLITLEKANVILYRPGSS